MSVMDVSTDSSPELSHGVELLVFSTNRDHMPLPRGFAGDVMRACRVKVNPLFPPFPPCLLVRNCLFAFASASLDCLRPACFFPTSSVSARRRLFPLLLHRYPSSRR